MKKLKGVIFDWAGTVVDHGSRAPVATLLDVFKAAGWPITVEEARAAMGIAKRDHIASILRRRRPPVLESDIDALYSDFIPKQFSCLRRYSDVIRGVPELVARLRARGLKIGSTTGYTRPMLDHLLASAAAQGFVPDAAFSPGDVPAGRPAPWMCFLNAIQLGVYPMSAMVKVGDTPSDIEEGLNAGMWTIGVTRTGNEVGLSEREWNGLTRAAQEQALDRAAARLRAAGAHYIVESVADCEAVLEEIDNLA